ncbi:MAG: serine/threonine-protein kinase [Planctomycetota bacterium]|nr:serine/threonine-protein kinase [Planctomycetota bacterium]
MSNENYQRAKAVFGQLVDESATVQKKELDRLEQEFPKLAQEVRSLLDYHTQQSLVLESPTPRIRTRSTLSTTYRSTAWARFRGISIALAVSLPLLLVGLLLALWIDMQVHSAVEFSLSEQMSAAADRHRDQFVRWEQRRLQQAQFWAHTPQMIRHIEALVEKAKGQAIHSGDWKDAEYQQQTQQLHESLKTLAEQDSMQLAIWDQRMVQLFDSSQANRIETEDSSPVASLKVESVNPMHLSKVLGGVPKVILPNTVSLQSDGSESSAEGILVIVPVQDENGTVIAALLLKDYGLETEYQSIIESWSSSGTLDVYLIDQRGALLSKSRYAAEMAESPIKAMPRSKSFMILDPGADLLAGEEPATDATNWPRTLMANRVTSGNNEVNTTGYRNYVGRRVVGAWRWMPEYELGLAIEQEHQDAFRVAVLVRFSVYSFAIGCFAFAMLGTSLSVYWANSRSKQLRDLSEVGPYQVQELLGEGGMGKVFLAEHALLCRQSAVKVLTHRAEDLSVIGRFEREVQLASQLTHPNTISIFDFGRNRDGLFYYAMEYINGAHLGQLVDYIGPIPPGRCIYILRQLCNALQEAHQAGVVHRDIKPQNIMVCNRGGEPDFVKLFDYGLVKSFAPGVSENSAQTRVVVGTPRFMAPERLNSPWLADPRVDVYSVGALAYYLLTAQLPPLVTMDDGLHTHTQVETLDLPADVVAFGEILSLCMAVEPAARPSSMLSLVRDLDELGKEYRWSREDSLVWWAQHEAKLLHLVKNKRKDLAKTARIAE